jgi:hypothetical protein
VVDLSLVPEHRRGHGGAGLEIIGIVAPAAPEIVSTSAA